MRWRWCKTVTASLYLWGSMGDEEMGTCYTCAIACPPKWYRPEKATGCITHGHLWLTRSLCRFKYYAICCILKLVNSELYGVLILLFDFLNTTYTVCNYFEFYKRKIVFVCPYVKILCVFSYKHLIVPIFLYTFKLGVKLFSSPCTEENKKLLRMIVLAVTGIRRVYIYFELSIIIHSSKI